MQTMPSCIMLDLMSSDFETCSGARRCAWGCGELCDAALLTSAMMKAQQNLHRRPSKGLGTTCNNRCINNWFETYVLHSQCLNPNFAALLTCGFPWTSQTTMQLLNYFTQLSFRISPPPTLVQARPDCMLWE